MDSKLRANAKSSLYKFSNRKKQMDNLPLNEILPLRKQYEATVKAINRIIKKYNITPEEEMEIRGLILDNGVMAYRQFI